MTLSAHTRGNALQDRADFLGVAVAVYEVIAVIGGAQDRKTAITAITATANHPEWCAA